MGTFILDCGRIVIRTLLKRFAGENQDRHMAKMKASNKPIRPLRSEARRAGSRAAAE